MLCGRAHPPSPALNLCAHETLAPHPLPWSLEPHTFRLQCFTTLGPCENGITWALCFRVWRVSLSITSSRLVHGVADVTTSFLFIHVIRRVDIARCVYPSL